MTNPVPSVAATPSRPDDVARARSARERLEQTLANAASLDAERAVALAARIETARDLLLSPKKRVDLESLQAELDAALRSAVAYMGEAVALAQERERVNAQAKDAARSLEILERCTILAAAKAEALEKARSLEADDDSARAGEIQRRLELESELRSRLSECSQLSARLTDAERSSAQQKAAIAAAEERVAEERRRRLAAQIELEELENRHEKSTRDRMAVEEDFKTLKGRFDTRTKRLYRSLILNEGGLGEHVSDMTRELMEANEMLLRLQTDRDSLIRQVEKLRLGLRKAKGLPETMPLEEEDRVGAAQAQLTQALENLKDRLERRLENLGEDLSRIISAAPRPEPGEPRNESARAERSASFYVDGPLAATDPAALRSSPSAETPAPPPSAETPAQEGAPEPALLDHAPDAPVPAAPPPAEEAPEPAPADAETVPSGDAPSAAPASETDERKKTTHHQGLQKALEKGEAGGTLEVLFRKRRKKLRSSQTGHDERTPADTLEPGREDAAAATLGDALARAKDAVARARDEENPALLDDDDAGNELPYDAEVAEAMLRSFDDGDTPVKGVPTRPDDGTLDHVVPEAPPSESFVEAMVRRFGEGAEPKTGDLNGQDTVDIPALEKAALPDTVDLPAGAGSAVAPAEADAGVSVVLPGTSAVLGGAGESVVLPPSPVKKRARANVKPSAEEKPGWAAAQPKQAAPGAELSEIKICGIPLPPLPTKPMRPPSFIKVAGRSPGSAEPPPDETPDKRTFHEIQRALKNAPIRAEAAQRRRVRFAGLRELASQLRDGIAHDLRRRPHAFIAAGAVVILGAVVLGARAHHRARVAAAAPPEPPVQNNAELGALDEGLLELWATVLRKHAQAIEAGETDAVRAPNLYEFSREGALLEAAGPATTACGLPPAHFVQATKRIGIAEAIFKASSRRAQEYRWTSEAMREDALGACGKDAVRRQDVEFCILHAEEIRRAWAAVAEASRGVH